MLTKNYTETKNFIVKTEAAIDIGTNTMLLLIAEIEESSSKRKIKKILADEIDFVKLGEKVHENRFFLEEAKTRAKKVFERYSKICVKYNVDRVHAIATSASRDSKNAKSFFEEIHLQTKIQVRIIDGKTEARLSFLGGLLPSQDPKKSLIIDIGGGSTEFVFLNTSKKVEEKMEEKLLSTSIDIGCVRASELYLKNDPYSKESLDHLINGLFMKWKEIPKDYHRDLMNKDWVGVAGTATTIACLKLELNEFDSEKVNDSVLSLDDVEKWFLKLSKMTNEARKNYSILKTGRTEVIVPGAAILMTAMKQFKKDSIKISSQGLRHGVLCHPLL